MVHWYERYAGTQPSFIAARCYCCWYRPAQIFVNGVLSWDRLHMMISRSTTPDLIKIVNKLEEFFIQQHKSGMRALAVMTPAAARRGKASMPAPAATNTECELKHCVTLKFLAYGNDGTYVYTPFVCDYT